MKALANALILPLLAGCVFSSAQTRNEQPGQPVDTGHPNWLGADIKALPIAGNPQALADMARELCTWPAPYGQKIYAMRLAAHASSLEKKNKTIALTYSRTAFFAADGSDDETSTKKFAETGAAAARAAGLNKENPEICYYFALNQGIIVRAKGLFALSKVPEIFEALTMARASDGIDWGGPLRVLGMLYLKAPAWPTGIGDLDKALELLGEAVRKYPIHPLNYIFYAEALIEDDNREQAKSHLDIAEKLAIPEMWGAYYSSRWRADIDRLRKKISD